jgi:molybdopterin synthase catalytic subunit
VGEISVAIAASAAHRAAAFAACRYVIEQIKKRLPVWKQERYVGGAASWLAGEVPHAG